MKQFSDRALCDAFGAFITGVTVVTAADDSGRPAGFTANAFTSVSLSPPLLLVCPARRLSSFAVFENCRRFAVSVLAETQRDVANLFAFGRGDRFARVAWHADGGGCPLIDGAAASFSCATHRRMDGGDHIILLGEIEECRRSGAAGLGYVGGGYFSLGLEHRAADLPRSRSPAVVGAIVDCGNKVLMAESAEGMRPPQTVAEGGGLSALRRLFADAGLEVDIGAVYSVFPDGADGGYRVYYRGTAKNADPRGLGAYYAPEELPTMRFCDEATAAMMRRYAEERRHGAFGLYVGDDAQGEVLPMAGGAA